MDKKETLCGANCSVCGFQEKCKGCSETCGSPFGGKCLAAEYIKFGGKDAYRAFKQQLAKEINDLHIEGMPEVKELFELNGAFVNLEYALPSGEKVKFLKDNDIYLGTQLECEFADDQAKMCFGVVVGMDFILICTYGENGTDAELVRYQQR